jgi:hypothetical protein
VQAANYGTEKGWRCLRVRGLIKVSSFARFAAAPGIAPPATLAAGLCLPCATVKSAGAMRPGDGGTPGPEPGSHLTVSVIDTVSNAVVGSPICNGGAPLDHASRPGLDQNSLCGFPGSCRRG